MFRDGASRCLFPIPPGARSCRRSGAERRCFSSSKVSRKRLINKPSKSKIRTIEEQQQKKAKEKEREREGKGVAIGARGRRILVHYNEARLVARPTDRPTRSPAGRFPASRQASRADERAGGNARGLHVGSRAAPSKQTKRPLT